MLRTEWYGKYYLKPGETERYEMRDKQIKSACYWNSMKLGETQYAPSQG